MPTETTPSPNGVAVPTAHPTGDTVQLHDRPAIALEMLKEEHKRRRDEIREYGATIERDQRNGIIMTAVFWSWLASDGPAAAARAPFEGLLVFLPSVLMAIFFGRWRSMRRAIGVNAEYLRLVEGEAGMGLLGWESWLKEKRLADSWAASVGWATRTLWVCLILTNLAIALLFLATRGGWLSR